MQSIEETRLSNGLLQKVTDTIVGRESEELKAKFAARRAELESRLESGETQSAIVRETRRIGRNDPCPCGSGVKFKKCCGSRLAKDDERIATTPEAAADAATQGEK